MQNQIVSTSGTQAIEASRAIQEVQAQVVLAKQFPRDEDESLRRILKACGRKSVSSEAIYTYVRGSEVVEGPSIRLAEVIAQNWGNLQFGVRELSQENGFSEVEAYAWDLETNNRSSKIFRVPHKRHTRNGSYDLKDPRDIYETVANAAARRMRNCILALIPGDIVESAVEESKKTLKANLQDLPALVTKIQESFSKFGVTREKIEEKLGHNLESINEKEYLTMQGWYRAINDGITKPEQIFTPKQSAQERQTAGQVVTQELTQDGEEVYGLDL